MYLAHGVGFGGVGEGRRVGDQLGVGGEQRADDPQPGRGQGPAGLGEIDHRVHDVGHLGLGGPVAQGDAGLDPGVGEEAAGQLGVLGGHPDAGGQVRHRLVRRVPADGQHHPHRIGRGLRVAQLAQRLHRAVGLGDPVAAGDAQVEEAVGHVHRNLLGAQDADLVDAGVVDAGPVGHRGRPDHPQIGLLEQLQGGLFERSLGQNELQHGQSLIADRRAWGDEATGRRGLTVPPADSPGRGSCEDAGRRGLTGDGCGDGGRSCRPAGARRGPPRRSPPPGSRRSPTTTPEC